MTKIGNREAILKRLDALISILELRNKEEKKAGQEIFNKIDLLIKKTEKENKKYAKEHYWRWQMLMIGLKDLKKQYGITGQGETNG